MAASRACAAIALAVALTSNCGGDASEQPRREAWRRDAVLAFTRDASAIWIADGKWIAHRLRPGTEPHWSPDGRRLLVRGLDRPAPSPTLVVYDLERGTSRGLTKRAVTDPAWTSTGGIAYFRERDGCDNALWLADPNSGAATKIAQSRICDEDLAHDWSPDGNRLALAACDLVGPGSHGEQECDLVLVDARGRRRRSILSSVVITRLAWAPDSSAIAFVGSRRSSHEEGGVVAGSSGAYVFELASRKLERVVAGGISDFAWTPDGRWLMYTLEAAPGSSGLWRVTPDGSRREELLRPRRASYTEIAISPDAKYAAAVAETAGSPPPTLDVIELNDGILTHRFRGDIASPEWRPARERPGRSG